MLRAKYNNVINITNCDRVGAVPNTLQTSEALQVVGCQSHVFFFFCFVLGSEYHAAPNMVPD